MKIHFTQLCCGWIKIRQKHNNSYCFDFFPSLLHCSFSFWKQFINCLIAYFRSSFDEIVVDGCFLFCFQWMHYIQSNKSWILFCSVFDQELYFRKPRNMKLIEWTHYSGLIWQNYPIKHGKLPKNALVTGIVISWEG